MNLNVANLDAQKISSNKQLTKYLAENCNSSTMKKLSSCQYSSSKLIESTKDKTESLPSPHSIYSISLLQTLSSQIESKESCQ